MMVALPVLVIVILVALLVIVLVMPNGEVSRPPTYSMIIGIRINIDDCNGKA